MMTRNEHFWQGWQGAAVFLNRLMLCALVWWLLSGGAVESWLVGAPVTIVAALLSTWMLPALRWSWRSAPRFWAYFLWHSLRGGLDVAARALHWRLPLQPGMFAHRSRLPSPAARVSLANLVSLLPGTLSVDLENGELYVHALDASAETRDSLNITELVVGDLFSLPLEAPEGDDSMESTP